MTMFIYIYLYKNLYTGNEIEQVTTKIVYSAFRPILKQSTIHCHRVYFFVFSKGANKGQQKFFEPNL